MIGRVRGALIAKSSLEVLVDIQGACFELTIPMSTHAELPEVGETVELHTHLRFHDDSLTLYGFHSERERSLFRILIAITGVGARTALTILSSVSVDEFARLVVEEDAASLARMRGIGKKTAQRLVLELREKLADWSLAPRAMEREMAEQKAHDEALAALLKLGFKPQEAGRALEQATEDVGHGDAAELLRRALKLQAKRS